MWKIQTQLFILFQEFLHLLIIVASYLLQENQKRKFLKKQRVFQSVSGHNFQYFHRD